MKWSEPVDSRDNMDTLGRGEQLGLCWKCKEKIINLLDVLTPLGEQIVGEVFHCHHEPKEKLKCACDCTKFRNMKVFAHEINTGDQWNLGPSVFCPKCGRKL